VKNECVRKQGNYDSSFTIDNAVLLQSSLISKPSSGIPFKGAMPVSFGQNCLHLIF